MRFLENMDRDRLDGHHALDNNSGNGMIIKSPDDKRTRRSKSEKAPFQLSRRLNLTDDELSPLVRYLIKRDYPANFSANRPAIVKAWTSSVMTTFDKIDLLTENKKGNRLAIRFGYISIASAIQGLPRKHVLQSYRAHTTRPSGVALSESQVVQHIRIAERYRCLTGSTPFILCLFSSSVETIMYVCMTVFLCQY
jgi:hypothetical protein